MVNGKQVGGMTDVNFQEELDLSAPYLFLAISRYKHAVESARTFAAEERRMLLAMNRASRDKRLLGWYEVGNGVDPTNAGPSLEGGTSAVAGSATFEDLHQCGRENGSSDGTEGPPNNAKKQRTDAESPRSKKPARQSFEEIRVHKNDSGSENDDTNDEDDDDDDDDDPNPWLGCVCGEIHASENRKSDKMFWIQCESCKAWYDVAENCVGFTEVEAVKIINWHCEACISDSEDETEIPASGESGLQHQENQQIVGGNSTATGCNERAENQHEDDENEATGETMRTSTPLELTAAESLVQIMAASYNGNSDIPSSSFAQEKDEVNERSSTLFMHGYKRPRSSLVQREDGTYAKPAGRGSRKRSWDETRGLWAPCKNGKQANKDPVAESNHSMPSTNPPQGRNYGVRNTNEKDGKRTVRFDERTTKRSVTTRRCSNDGVGRSTDIDDSNRIFQLGELVHVEPHAWPGVNITGGVGRIVAMTTDKDGDRFYDVKYIVARYKETGIWEKFIRLEKFD
jgi:hypothetical protein